MIDRSDIKSVVRSQRVNLKTRMGRLYASTLEPKIARTFTDDVDIHHGALSIRCDRQRSGYRPGQRDDDRSCGFSALLTI
jgi:hypothetical protein